MATSRENSLGQGTHEYRLPNGNTARRMGNGEWCVFDPAGHDTGRDYATLRSARRRESATPAP